MLSQVVVVVVLCLFVCLFNLPLPTGRSDSTVLSQFLKVLPPPPHPPPRGLFSAACSLSFSDCFIFRFVSSGFFSVFFSLQRTVWRRRSRRKLLSHVASITEFQWYSFITQVRDSSLLSVLPALFILQRHYWPAALPRWLRTDSNCRTSRRRGRAAQCRFGSVIAGWRLPPRPVSIHRQKATSHFWQLTEPEIVTKNRPLCE